MAILFGGALLSTSPARALELHSFVDDRCQVTSGVLVRVDEANVHFVTLDGVRATLPVDGVALVVIHKVLENPLSRIAVDAPLRALARRSAPGATTSRDS